MDDLLERHIGIVNRLIHAELTERVVLAGPGGPQHVGAAGLSDLYGQVTHATGGGMDQYALSGSEVRGVDKSLPAGERGERQGRRLLR